MRARWVGVVAPAAAVAWLSACGGRAACPEGYERHGGVCEPVHEVGPLPDPGPDPDGPPDQPLDPPGEEIAVDVPPEKPIEAVQDLRETELPWPGGVIGRPCKKDDDCAGDVADAVCLDWIQGYCSVTGCAPGEKTCPEGSVCMAMTAATTACAATCESDADCRASEGYACKSVDDAEGNAVRACWQVVLEHGPGDPCGGAKDCAGAADCLTNFDDGYCAVRHCGEDWPCPDGTRCVKLNGVPTCMKSCSVDEDCKAGEALRACMPLTSADTGEKVKVCGSGTEGTPLGSICRNDSECTSFECFLAYTGKCSLSKSIPCKAVKDCPAGEVCIPSPDDTFGYCTKSCVQTCAFPNVGFCIGGEEKGTGQCLPPCGYAGDPACSPKAGLACVFGDPIGETGRYSCARVAPGALGAPCTSGTECKSGQCLSVEGKGGYCTGPCGFMAYCPFPTRCQTAGGQNLCLLRCASSGDCPEGLACHVPEGSTLDVCYPL